MTEAQAIELISQQMVSLWPAASGGLPLGLENEAMPDAPSFAYLTVQHTVSQQITMGGIARFVRQGWIYVKLWAPSDIGGRKALSTLADAVRGIFERVQLSAPPSEPVTIYAGLTSEVQAPSNSRWQMAVVRFPFRYYESR